MVQSGKRALLALAGGPVQPTLIDRIYETAFVPELWPAVLGELSGVAGARTGFLFVSRNDIHKWAASTSSGSAAVRPIVENGWLAKSDRFRRITDRRHSGFVTEANIYEPKELETDPFYQQLLYPVGLGHAAGTTVHLPTGDSFIVALERELARGPVEAERIAELDALRPHIGRSALMASRLRLEQATTISATLGAVGLAAAVLDGAGKVLAANSLLDDLHAHLHWRAFGGIALRDKAAHRLLHEALAQIAVDDRASVRSFPIRGSGDEQSFVAHVLPVRLTARDIFTRSAAVLLLTPVGLPNVASVELVQSLFDLTPAEARVARDLAKGSTLDTIALEGGVSRNTVRTQVRGVLEKTGCGRQSDIVALLTAISRASPAGDAHLDLPPSS